MKIIRLLGIITSFNLLMVLALSGNMPQSCSCSPSSCHCSRDVLEENDCCDGFQNSYSLFQYCSCLSQITSFPNTELAIYDPDYNYFGNVSPHTYTRRSSAGLTYSRDSSISPISRLNLHNIGPPDLDVVEYMPRSAKQVFDILLSDGPLTQKDLINKTGIPPRTVRYALNKLKGEDIIEERFCIQDARQSLYSVNGITTK